MTLLNEQKDFVNDKLCTDHQQRLTPTCNHKLLQVCKKNRDEKQNYPVSILLVSGDKILEMESKSSYRSMYTLTTEVGKETTNTKPSPFYIQKITTFMRSIDKTTVFQKRVMHLIHFKDRKEHTIPLFVDAKILPLNFIYIMNVKLKNVTIFVLL